MTHLFPTAVVLVAIAVGIVGVLVSSVRRAARDWPYAMRCVIALDRLAALDSPWGGFELTEVRVIEAVGGWCPFELHLAELGTGEELRLLLEETRSDLSPICDGWRRDNAPLLLATCDTGAVLYGPGIQLLGAVGPRDDHEWSGIDGYHPQ